MGTAVNDLDVVKIKIMIFLYNVVLIKNSYLSWKSLSCVLYSWILGPLMFADINLVTVFTIDFIDHSCREVFTKFVLSFLLNGDNGHYGFVGNIDIKLI